MSIDVRKLKGQMKKYAGQHGITLPRVKWDSPVWGLGAQRLAWRVSRHYSGGKAATTSKARLWRHFSPPLAILYPAYKWNGSPVKRKGGPPGIVWHHAAGRGSPQEIHHAHLKIGDRGIAYHYYVRRDGRVYAGRPEGTMGAHCLGHNNWIGVCADGNYEAANDMPAAQLRALQGLHAYLHGKYAGIPDRRHKDMSGNATACPGRNFPFAAVTG